MTWFHWLFSNVGFMPRAICGIWTPGEIFLHNASDFLIWTAYIAIPLVLVKFAYAKRRELPFRNLFWLFGLFILACGTTHFMDIVMFYNPLYRLAGVIKLVTALASWGTVFALFHVTPMALQMRSPEELEREIEQRQRAEALLQQAHDELEIRIQERTSDLQRLNAALNESDEQFQTMANSIPQLAWIARADGFVFWYNRRWHDYMGTTPGQEEEMRGKNGLDPEILPLVTERWQHAVTTGTRFEMEFPLRGADGRSRIFLTRMEPVKDAQGNVVRWFGTNTDIDDQKCVQEELTASLALLEAKSAELSSSEARFRVLTEVMPQLVWAAQPDGFLDYYNEHWVEYTGMTMEQMQGWGWQPVLHPDDLKNCLDRWTESLRTGADYEVEYRFKRASDGTYRWHLGRALPLRDENGNISKWFGTCTDIDDQKRAQMELQRSQQELETLIQERTGELSQANEEQQRLLAELALSNAELESRVARRTAALEARTEELNSSLSLITATIESTADGIMALDLSGNAVSFNTKFKSMWHLPAHVLERSYGPELQTYAAKQLKEPDEFFELVQKHLSAPEIETFDVIEMRDGRTFERYGFPQRVSEACVGTVVNYREITERKQAEAEREELLAKEQQARGEAERANAAKDEFLSRMSHELRTPLNAILGFGQILEMQEKQLTALQNESVQQILKAGQHQLDLVNEVLDITRIQSQDSSLSLEPVALSEIVQEALDMLQSLASPTGISLHQQLRDAPPIFVLVDRQRLLQILLNLLANAIKFNKPNGQVSVFAEVLPENRVRFHVRDTGHGIAAEDLSKLFVPFARLNADMLGVEGTGLGLVLCQRLAEAMNGSLQVESQIGLGSTFSVELPLAPTPNATPDATQAATQAATQSAALIPSAPHLNGAAPPISVASMVKHTILLIEDNISNFQLIERIFDDLSDVQLVGAMQGGLGVELALLHRPDLILLDLNLPDIMGDEVLRRLQANPETRDIPVIILSADATPSQISLLLALGARQYLTKPLDVRDFLHTVKETIHAR